MIFSNHFSAVNPSLRELLVCSSVLKPAYSDELVLLVRSLTYKPPVVDTKGPTAYVHLILDDNVVVYGSCGLIRDLGLTKSTILVALPPLDADLPTANHAKAMTSLR